MGPFFMGYALFILWCYILCHHPNFLIITALYPIVIPALRGDLSIYEPRIRCPHEAGMTIRSLYRVVIPNTNPPISRHYTALSV